MHHTTIHVVPPEEDKRVQLILTELTKGKTRDELAEELEYSTYKSLGVYMRRKGYRFNSQI